MRASTRTDEFGGEGEKVDSTPRNAFFFLGSGRGGTRQIRNKIKVCDAGRWMIDVVLGDADPFFCGRPLGTGRQRGNGRVNVNAREKRKPS